MAPGVLCRFDAFARPVVLLALCALGAVRWCACAGYEWQPPPDKVVVLVVNTHPDDEGIFFGGTLPYYTAVLKVPTVLISMTSGGYSWNAGYIREEELRCAAWTYGMRHEPLFPRFTDVHSAILPGNPYTNKMDATWDYWADGVMQGDGSDVEAGKQKAINYLAEQIRRFRPEVIITHDEKGETGHHNHIATAQAVTNAFFVAADPAATATNLAGLPPWQAKKLYLHLYPTNRLFHTFFEMPFIDLQNRSCRQVADEGLRCHVSQHQPNVATVYLIYEFHDGYDSEWWGLYASTVGPDSPLLQDTFVEGYRVPAGASVGNFLQNINVARSSRPSSFVSDHVRLPAATAGLPYSAQNLARWVQDPWGDLLSYKKLSGPEWLVIGPDGSLSGLPGRQHAGTNIFVVQVSGADTSSSRTSLQIEVQDRFPAVDHLTGWWRLDETVGPCHDSASPSQDGVVSNVDFGLPGAVSSTGRSASFNGYNSKIDVPWSPDLNPPRFTVALWANVAGTTGTYRSPLSSREVAPQSGYVFYATPNDHWQLWLGSADDSWKVLSGGTVRSNSWMHLAATYDGVSARFYTNGVLASSEAVAMRPNARHPLRIGAGASESTGQFWFPGHIDDVRVYSSALSSSAIAMLYSSRAPEFVSSSLTRGPVAVGQVNWVQTLAGAATDPDPGENAEYGKLSGPDWLKVSPDGTLSGIPSSKNLGINAFEIGAVDPIGTLGSSRLEIEVTPGKPGRFTGISHDVGMLQIQITGPSERLYVLEATHSLALPEWVPLTVITTGTNGAGVVNTAGAGGQQFFRLALP